MANVVFVFKLQGAHGINSCRSCGYQADAEDKLCILMA